MRMRNAGMIAGLLLAAAAVPALAQDENTWGYDKGFFFHTPKFELKISTRTQFRYTYTMFDQASTFDDFGSFTIPRARLRLDGFAWFPWLKYKVQYDFEGAVEQGIAGNIRREPDLRDLYLDLARNPRAIVRLGQFKAPFGIQELTSGGEQQFVDRSIASELFAPQRQEGAMLWGTSHEKKFGYEVGMFDGNQRNVLQNDNAGYMYVARAHWDPNGEYKLSESAVDHPEKVNWTIGAAYLANEIQPDAKKTTEAIDEWRAEGFFALKYKRLSVLGDYYERRAQQAAGAPDVRSDGYIAQVGFFVVPRRHEIALRYSGVNHDQDASNGKETEKRIGYGFFFSKHDFKFQADYGQVEVEASATDSSTDQFRAQLQIVF